MEEDITIEIKEKLAEVTEHSGWNKYLSISTALIAVFAAIASLLSGNYANQALLEKNNAILNQSKASDQYAYYQAKGIKKNISDGFYLATGKEQLKKDAERYGQEQDAIKRQADNYITNAENNNKRSELLFERHHKLALSVTFFQIAIALSAMSALLKRKSMWYLSLLLGAVGITFLVLSFV